MNKKLRMRVLAILLCATMLVGLAPAASAASNTTSNVNQQYQTIAQFRDHNHFVKDQVDPDAPVSFIVELEEAPLIHTMPAGLKMAAYLTTAQGDARHDAIERQQDKMARAIELCADNITITHRYKMVINGFAVKASYGDRAALEALDGVKRVTLGNVYSVPEQQDAEGEVITSGEMIHSDSVNAEGYTGKGTFAAIIDTGLNVNHEAFVGETVKGAVVTAETINALNGLTASGNLYKNAKVAFAYDYADVDDDVKDAQGHGTHVAGTVGANGESFRGVAPDAQLAIMKVFSDNGKAYDSDIITALEDCVILGVDTVNMSLGKPCGFTYEGDAIDAVYNAVRSAGINLMVSAGNEANSAYMNQFGTDLPLASNPDYGIVGSPSTYGAAVSVASVNNSRYATTYLKLGDTRIPYTETPDSPNMIGAMEGEYEYVAVPGVGSMNDFASVDVTDKIALVQRGDLSFTEKEENAYNAGAIAMIVYDNTDSWQNIYMQLAGYFPAVFVSKSAGEMLKQASKKVVSLSTSYYGLLESPIAGQMSSFSSMGVAPDLTLKPEITAPGGNVWSTSASGGYEEMSGTSMAAPHMTGAAAVMHQYVNETFPTLSNFEKQALVDNLLISTADIVLDPTGVPYTPRKQGAGLANLSAAVHTGAYLSVDGGIPKAQLGESENGTYEFTFTIHSIADSVQTYNLSLEPIAAQAELINGQSFISDLCRRMADDELTVSFSKNSVTLNPGQSMDVTVKISLTEKGKQNFSAFPNGIYVEGFVRLTGDDVVSLGLPYLGFYGDWADAPIFDSTRYDDEPAFIAESVMVMLDYNGSGDYLGVNAVSGSARADWISYASHTAGYYLVTPLQGLLRAPGEIRYSVTPKDDPNNKVYEVAYKNAFKSFYYSSGGFIHTDYVRWEQSWQAIGGNDAEGYYYLPDGLYTYTIDARVDGEIEYQSMEYPIYVDNEAPSIVGYTYYVVDGTRYLSIQVTDNHYVMAAQLMDENCTQTLSPAMAIEETEIGAVSTLVFDLSYAASNGFENCRLDLYDYAWNEMISDVIPVDNEVDEPVDKSKLQALVNEASIELERLSSKVFPADLFAALEEAFAAANAGLSDPNATQEQIDQLYAALYAALQAVNDYAVNVMYSDVPEGEWYYDAVDFATRYGFMSGMDDGTFTPAGIVNRAQFVVILYRMAGSPEVTSENPFVDVPANDWFTDAVLWAYENGITTGIDDTHFNPGGQLVRQNMVTFLMRFAAKMGLDTSARADLSAYTDADEIQPHASAAMQWAVAEGIISGMSSTTLGPNGLANRAQIATIIQRFVTNLLW